MKRGFQCSSASRKFLNRNLKSYKLRFAPVSVLFSEPKIPQLQVTVTSLDADYVSVLFSEPKIPQSKSGSASLNPSRSFQCSSASRKFLNSIAQGSCGRTGVLFQCSSASRKFLNWKAEHWNEAGITVSVLFSEPKIPQSQQLLIRFVFNELVSVLFSEPKIPQSSTRSSRTPHRQRVSVLFSEPKIPQLNVALDIQTPAYEFQCSSASRKFLNPICRWAAPRVFKVSVLFSEPKIPQLRRR